MELLPLGEQRRGASRKRGGPSMSAIADQPAPPPAADPESCLHDDHHEALRLWLRLLTCTLLIERRIRARLRLRFAMTLPRFDLMAQLERNPDGLRMGELSRRLMVTGGNVTGITEALVAERLVLRQPIPGDRRAHAVRLTPKGKRAFEAMAAEHAQWVEEMVSGIGAGERERLQALLGRLQTAIRARDRDGMDANAAEEAPR